MNDVISIVKSDINLHNFLLENINNMFDEYYGLMTNLINQEEGYEDSFELPEEISIQFISLSTQDNILEYLYDNYGTTIDGIFEDLEDTKDYWDNNNLYLELPSEVIEHIVQVYDENWYYSLDDIWRSRYDW